MVSRHLVNSIVSSVFQIWTRLLYSEMHDGGEKCHIHAYSDPQELQVSHYVEIPAGNLLFPDQDGREGEIAYASDISLVEMTSLARV